MSNIGPSALPPDQLDRVRIKGYKTKLDNLLPFYFFSIQYNRLVNDMLAIYNKASICRFEQPFNCGLRLQPELKEVIFHYYLAECTKYVINLN